MTTHMLLRVPTDCCWQPRRWEVGHVMAIMLLAFIAMLLSACGGGGGGASDDPPAPGLTFPVITSQPVSTAVAAGMTATFGVIASGNGLAFAWQRSTNVGLAWQSIPGASGVSYTTPSLDASANGHQFRVVIQNPAGVVTSSSATLTVTGVAAAPTITRQPQDQVSTPPDPATFSVAVTGSPTPSIRWQFSNDGGRIWSDFSQASSTTYTTPNNSYLRARAFVNGFKYRAVATNASGTITSDAATWLVRSRTLRGMPSALHIDASGELTAIIAPNYGPITIGDLPERFAGLVQRISPTGTVSNLAGSGIAGFVNAVGSAARFQSPLGVARDREGNVYIADELNRVIRKVTPDGTVSTFAGSGLNGSNDGPVTTARFSKPRAVGVTSDGTVYVSDAGINRLRKISGGVVTTPGIIGSFVDIAVDTADTLYLLQGGLVAKITAAGVASTLGGLPGLQFAEDESTTMRFRGLAVDNAGNVFVTDVGLCLVRKITPEGIVTTLAGAPITSTERCGYIDGVGRTAKFGEDLAGIAVDAAGNLYVADGDNLAIRKITATGLVTTLAR